MTETVTETVTETTTEPSGDDAPEVIVVDTGDSGGDDSGTALETGKDIGALTVMVETLAASVTSLSERVDTLASRTEFAETIAIDAANEVSEVVAEAEEVAEETAAEIVDEIITPDREHFVWRNPLKLRRGNSGED
jgi:methyl-accepting chemotaxis protein